MSRFLERFIGFHIPYGTKKSKKTGKPVEEYIDSVIIDDAIVFVS